MQGEVLTQCFPSEKLEKRLNYLDSFNDKIFNSQILHFSDAENVPIADLEHRDRVNHRDGTTTTPSATLATNNVTRVWRAHVVDGLTDIRHRRK